MKPSEAFVLAWVGVVALISYAWLSEAQGFTLAVAICCAIVLGAAASHSSDRMVAGPVTILCIVAVLSYSLRPLALAGGSPSFAVRLDRSNLNFASLVSLVFVTAMAMGIWTSRSRSKHGTPSLPSQKAVPQIGLAVAVALVISIAAYIANCRLVGVSLTQPFLDPINFRSVTSANGQYYVTAVAVNFAWLPYWIALIYRGPEKRRRTSLQSMQLILAGGFAAFMTVPYGQRSYFLTPIVGTLWFVESRGYRLPLKRLLPIAMVVILGSGYYSTYRELNSTNARGGMENVWLALGSGANKALDSFSSRFDSFDFLGQTLQTWDEPYLYGRSLIDFAAQPLPRSLYPNKPPQTSLLLITKQEPEVGTKFTPEFGMATELYINGGLLAVGFGGLIFGALMAKAGRIRAARLSGGRCLVVAPLVYLPSAWFLSGFNSFASVSAVFSVITSLVGAWLVRTDQSVTMAEPESLPASTLPVRLA